MPFEAVPHHSDILRFIDVSLNFGCALRDKSRSPLRFDLLTQNVRFGFGMKKKLNRGIDLPILISIGLRRGCSLFFTKGRNTGKPFRFLSGKYKKIVIAENPETCSMGVCRLKITESR